MAIEHLAAVWKYSRQSGGALLVLAAVASHSDANGVWIADQATLQSCVRLGRRRVQQILGELVAAGELAVVSHHGRGKLSTYRLLVETEKAKPSAPLKGEAQCAFPIQKGEGECTLSAEKGEAECTLSAPLAPPCPPLPPCPPDPLIPLYPLIPLTPPEKQKQETCGLRPLAGPQSAVFRVNLLLEEAAVPLPSPAQIGLWSKTLGGIEPLLELLGRLIHAGLANKRQPIAYVHRVVMEQAARPARPEPGKTISARAGRELLRAAGVDDIRRAQALRIIAGKRGTS